MINDFNEIKKIMTTYTIFKLKKIISSSYNEFIYTEKEIQELIYKYFPKINKDRIKRLFKYNFIFDEYTLATCFNNDNTHQEIVEQFINIQRSKTNTYIWKQYQLFNSQECCNRIIYFPERIVNRYLSFITSGQEDLNFIDISPLTLSHYIYQTIGHERRHMIQSQRCYRHYRNMYAKQISNDETDDNYQEILAERDADWYGHQFAISLMFD